MLVKLLRQIFAALTVAAYFGATLVGAAPPLWSLDLASHSAHSHAVHGHQHDQKSGSDTGECLKCCLGVCLGGPCLAAPTNAGSTLAFDSTAVRYSTTLSALAGRSVAPDPSPPRPIA